MTIATPVRATLRSLRASDLAAVVAIDAGGQGRSRQSYLQRRLAAAVREPDLHVQLCMQGDAGLTGFILARVLEGEFGAPNSALRLEVIGVHPDARGRGVGTELFEGLLAWGARHAMEDIETQAAWTDHSMLRWLAARGFRLAPMHVVECAVELGSNAPAPETDTAPSAETRYDDQPVPDARLARDLADVCTMRTEDLPEIVRIDRHVTGRDRRAYIERKLDEAMQDSGVRVSLTARVDGSVAGYLMARADYGDFGRPESVAVLDTLGVDPAFTHRGIGHALVAQLCANLRALQIERVETIVAPRNLALLAFFQDAGFAPSQRLPFMRRIAA